MSANTVEAAPRVGWAEGSPALRFRIAAAYLALCFIWGSTYLAIRYAVETLPPLWMIGVRVLLAGAILHAWNRLRGGARPTARAWRESLVTGGFFFVGGQGCLAWAEQTVDSSVASVVSATLPLWLAGMRITPLRDPRVLFGLVLGLAGVGALVGGTGAGAVDPVGAAVVLGSTIAWSIGSLRSLRVPERPEDRPTAATQLIAGGVLLFVAGGLTGELAQLDVGAISARSVLAMLYLAVFGSIVAFGAYAWLLKVCDPYKVGTYTYVNPLVAIALGWLAGEPMTARLFLGTALVLVALGFVLVPQQRPGGRA